MTLAIISSCGVGGIDAEVQGDEAPCLALAALHEPGEVEDGSAEAIELGHHQRAGAGTDRGEGGREARPAIMLTGDSSRFCSSAPGSGLSLHHLAVRPDLMHESCIRCNARPPPSCPLDQGRE